MLWTCRFLPQWRHLRSCAGEPVYCTVRFAGEPGQGGSLPALAFLTLIGALQSRTQSIWSNQPANWSQ